MEARIFPKLGVHLRRWAERANSNRLRSEALESIAVGRAALDRINRETSKIDSKVQTELPSGSPSASNQALMSSTAQAVVVGEVNTELPTSDEKASNTERKKAPRRCLKCLRDGRLDKIYICQNRWPNWTGGCQF